MAQGAPQRPQPVRLTDDIGMQRDAHDQGLGFGLFQHLLEGLDDHVGEVDAGHLARHYGGNIVEFLRIGYGQDRAAVAGAEPDGLVVHRPVENIGIAGFGEQVGRHRAFGNPRAEPSPRRAPFGLADAPHRVDDQGALVALVQAPLPLGIGAAVADDLVAAPGKGRHELRRLIVEFGIYERRSGQAERIEHLQHPPGADAVAPVAPCVIEHVRLVGRGRELGAEAFAEGEGFQIERDIDRQPPALRPVIERTVRQRAVIVTSVPAQVHGASRGTKLTGAAGGGGLERNRAPLIHSRSASQ